MLNQRGFITYYIGGAKVNIDEAITDLSIQLEVKRRVGAERAATALQLGIEALKRLQDYQKGVNIDLWSKLPGETGK